MHTMYALNVPQKSTKKDKNFYFTYKTVDRQKIFLAFTFGLHLCDDSPNEQRKVKGVKWKGIFVVA